MAGQVQKLVVEGFRSIRDLEVSFGDVNVITGPNGCGKSNLFNAFRLIKAAVEGGLAQAIADQGGLDSILWAGRRDSGPVRLRLSVVTDPFEYSLELGLRPRNEFPLFPLDPQIKSEVVKLAGRVLFDRKTSVAKIRGLDGPWDMRTDLVDSESVFAQIRDPERYPYLFLLQESVRRWTFYHEFRTDPESPLRRPALATYSPRLAENGANLGPTMYVIANHGEVDRMNEVLRAAFPDAEFAPSQNEVGMQVSGIDRRMTGIELSDGTIKFLCLVAACFGTRPPPLIAFNEPENSLNAAAIEPLADALAHASQFSQLWITTHSEALSRALVTRVGCEPTRLDKVDGETVAGGRSRRKGWVSEDE